MLPAWVRSIFVRQDPDRIALQKDSWERMRRSEEQRRNSPVEDARSTPLSRPAARCLLKQGASPQRRASTGFNHKHFLSRLGKTGIKALAQRDGKGRRDQNSWPFLGIRGESNEPGTGRLFRACTQRFVERWHGHGRARAVHSCDMLVGCERAHVDDGFSVGSYPRVHLSVTRPPRADPLRRGGYTPACPGCGPCPHQRCRPWYYTGAERRRESLLHAPPAFTEERKTTRGHWK